MATNRLQQQINTLHYRTIDGSQNGPSSAHYNATNTDFTRIGPAHFADDLSVPLDGINPRTISNVVVGSGDANVPNPEGLSGMMYAWGQFIDHDLDLMRTDGITHLDITVPDGDPNFPAGTIIPLTRVVTDPSTGKDPAHPATAVNAITGWLDASMVYGSDAATAASLRTADGHMKTSAGDNLPIVDGAYLAGDVRASENPSLTALQTLFVREHNYQVDLLHHAHPNWSGDHLYQQARAIVGAEIAHITYDEFLPHLLGSKAIAPYKGYDATVDPRISEEFAGAAYRFGHSIVSAETERIDERGNQIGPSQDLKDVFFQSPADFAANSGADGILRHLAADRSQALDARIVDDLRNFLVDPPDGQDLAAINIERGRDLGLGTLNETRVALGLQPYTKFGQITDDAQTAAALKVAFGSVDKVDLWTGGLSEKHAPNAFVGPTFQKIIALQFENLRDGDRLWYENQGFDARTLRAIHDTSLADIIERDTATSHIQNDAFVFYDRHSGVAGGVAAEDPNSPQLVVGNDGYDVLSGGPLDDMLIAGSGTQKLTGGLGADAFVFSEHDVRAKVTDFDPDVDHLQFDFDGADRFDASDVSIQRSNNGSLIHVSDLTISLPGVDSHALGSGSFLFES